MELVASARLRRAQERIEAMRPYADRMLELMAGTARASASVQSLPLLQRREVRRRRSCPSRAIAAWPARSTRRSSAGRLRCTGARAQGVTVRWLRRSQGDLHTALLALRAEAQWGGFSDNPRYHDAQAIAHRLSELYSEGTVDRVVLVYNHFVSALVQQRDRVATCCRSRRTCSRRPTRSASATGCVGDFIFEPEPEQILERLLPVYLETEIYRALLESAASEQGARMTAMRNASKSAGELIDTLTLEMNRARQAEITQEILEVVAGADALTGVAPFGSTNQQQCVVSWLNDGLQSRL